jgi:mannose/cellobiose epimerase-like protein (N-acyl-D-glucosamine 2-epimerase family)
MPARFRPDFRFSDLLAGIVVAYHARRRLVDLRTSDGREVRLSLAPTVHVEQMRNLGEALVALTGDLAAPLAAGQPLFAYGVLTPDAGGYTFEAHHLVLPRRSGGFAFEEPGWWTRQLVELAAFYRRAQFGTGPVDFTDYRTVIRLAGQKTDDHTQETDTLSRLLYGMASAYLLTGDESYLDIAERGCAYMREHMRFVDLDEDIVYWYHGIDVRDGVTAKLFASEFGDDHAAIPAYEQIYALVGLTQTYRITGDPRLRADIDATLRLFDRYFHDDQLDGWFSHVDPVHLDPHHPSLGSNRSRKNWNSIGDHAPAYLFNLYLATGARRYADMLEECFDLVAAHFPRPDSPFVQERFHRDWTPDQEWGWQQDRAVVGHNLKIAWNMMRMDALRPKRVYRQLAERIGRSMPEVALDTHRGGWYDVVERIAGDAAAGHRFTWHDRKAWWQQEQAILAYLILAGTTGDDEFRRLAQESSAFYNAFFLDHDDGGVYFNVLANGLPYLLGVERFKGSHSMSMYHTSELAYLATVYQRLLLDGEPLDLWFRPRGDADRLLRVAPDVLPGGRVVVERVTVDGQPYAEFDRTGLTVTLPASAGSLTVQVRLAAAR